MMTGDLFSETLQCLFTVKHLDALGAQIYVLIFKKSSWIICGGQPEDVFWLVGGERFEEFFVNFCQVKVRHNFCSIGPTFW